MNRLRRESFVGDDSSGRRWVSLLFDTALVFATAISCASMICDIFPYLEINNINSTERNVFRIVTSKTIVNLFHVTNRDIENFWHLP